MRFLVLAILCLSTSLLNGQKDTILTFREFIKIVKENHPVSFQAKLLSDMASSKKNMARGGFDPKIEGNWNHKSFDDKNYYSLTNGIVKVPTWYGIDLKAGYDRNSGQFLNDRDFIPTRGLWSAGISVPLGKGLIIDNRRAELKRADIYRLMTEQEQILMLNQLMFEASITYLNWQVATAQMIIANEGQALALERFNGTKSSFINGDKPAIDTLESYISLQNRQVDLQKAQQTLTNSTIALNNFLWLDGELPLEINPASTCNLIDISLLGSAMDSLSLLQDQWISSHPSLLLYDYKIDNLELDQKLAKEDLKPDLRINYNPLVGVADDSIFDQFNVNNYKIGASLSYSIMQRKERGKIDLNKLKIQGSEYSRSIKNQELNIKLKIYLNNINQTKRQYTLLTQTVDNYNRMLIAENRKLAVGESSIFLVNSRENKYLESRYKLVEASSKLLINRLIYLLHSARLGEIL